MERSHIFTLLCAVFVSKAVGTADWVHLENGDAEADIHPFGATIISWKINGHEQLFLSKASKMDGSSHIMGGVPIVFPKFSEWGEKRPFHGFARISNWSVVKVDGNKAEFSLRDSEVTRAYWNSSFRLNYTVELDTNELTSTLKIHNPSAASSCSFEVLFHTFIRVPDVREIKIRGLKETSYRSKVHNYTRFAEKRNEVVIDEITDSIYENTPNTIQIINAVNGKTMELVKSGLPDLVVWNPWSEVIKEFTDLENDEWTSFVCTEAGSVVTPTELQPGAELEVSQTLRILLDK